MKNIINRMLSMCPVSWYIFIGSIRFCCLMLLIAVILLIYRSTGMHESHSLYMTAISIVESTQGILLAAVLFSVLIEDRQS